MGGSIIKLVYGVNDDMEDLDAYDMLTKPLTGGLVYYLENYRLRVCRLSPISSVGTNGK